MTLNLENPLGLEPEELLIGALFGPTPELLAKMQHALDSFSNEEALEYGKQAAQQYIALPHLYHQSVEKLLQRGESLGLRFPEAVNLGFVTAFINQPRHTFDEALAQATAGWECDSGLANETRDALALLTDEQAYETGFEYGKDCLTGWNSAQFDADQIITLLETEMGVKLNEHVAAGIRDAQAHRQPAGVAA